MQTREPHSSHDAMRPALLADAAFEFVAGALLIVCAVTLGDWLLIGTLASVIGGVVFIGAGVAICALAFTRPLSVSSVQALAFANIVGGAVGWVLLIVAWQAFDPAGRATLGLASDLFIAIGLWELIELRAMRRMSVAR